MSELTEFRKAKDDFFGSDHHSPLTEEQRRGFEGLKYYEENPDLSMVLEIEPYEEQEIVEMQTTTGDVAEYARYGRIAFEVNGQPAQLTVFKDSERGDYFLPFADATSGKETYGSGRYLELQPLGGNKALVDFNYAYNPYCAYDDRWSCPITPFENRIKLPIEAGEKNFK